jgi:hypothetical protein
MARWIKDGKIIDEDFAYVVVVSKIDLMVFSADYPSSQSTLTSSLFINT